jgi:hypothetical protein
VQTADLNHDSTVEAFYDASTKLYWSNANAFNQLALASTKVAVKSATFEGITNWRLPTVAEFQSF